MLTTTHALVGMAIWAKLGRPCRNVVVLIGSLFPDLAIYFWAPWQRWGLGRDWGAIWDLHYFESFMQTLIAAFNSVPIFGLILLMGYGLSHGAGASRRAGQVMMLFALAALVHIALDAPVHASDAYRHVWPISDWRFHSPLSYWERSHHANWVSIVEALFVLGLTIILWRRFAALWVQACLAIILILTTLNAIMQWLAVGGSPV